ncbi:hypothetical protein HPB49_015444 [Dermacentor silvarum]|uniref:Uncharacterized protein n=1 Tax=Dermacentor silvarum TaxID=543639 RepID=A0ACB8DJP3_DERSI|nr:hypothetical protein HPB49_015444 [Dermacentor silvarum]
MGDGVSILESCRQWLVELSVYLWCIVVRLVFSLWFLWKKPLPLPPASDKLLLRSATSLAADIRDGKVKSVDLISAYIRRIREVQPIINAVVEERFEEALEDAKEVDRLVASGTLSASQMSKEKPLLGIPFTSKNSIAIKGLRQDAGSPFWHGRRAEEDAPSVALLRAAGAIPLALTNVCEMCMWDNALNLVDGRTGNPHDTRRSPGGSSGGEGSLLAAAGSLIGLGTDIGGSVRSPAAYCGIFGHKPTAGVVPNTGLLPDVGENLGEFNCVGPMTRFAEDLPLMLNVLAGSATNGLRLNEKVNMKTLKLYYMDTEGSRYISRVTTEARLPVTQHLNAVHGLEAQPLHLPELQFALFMWYKVCNAMQDKPLAEMFRPGGFNILVELLRYLVGAGRHTLAALTACTYMKFNRFSTKQEADAYIASLNSARDRLEETLGDDGVLILPAAVSAAPFQNQDLLLVVAKRGNDRLNLAVAREIEKHFGGWNDPSSKMQGKLVDETMGTELPSACHFRERYSCLRRDLRA